METTDNNDEKPTNIIDLPSLLVSSREKRQTEMEWKEGMIFTINYLPRPALAKIYENAHILKMNPGARARERVLDDTKFARALCAACVAGWKNVTLDALSRIIPIDTSNFTPEQLKQDIPFSQEQLVVLFKEAYELDGWIQSISSEMGFFVPEHGDELKNSEPSQSGN